ncbi:MAG: GDP-mannose 4,6-dehydratase, partial [Candidatus Aenigmarchaeota archaeon]|nr:GDP-mannose 4,6-dehydratase [Candidatus Aenigmarchaeota archaeon]
YVLSPQNLAHYFYREFYASDGNKRIPKIILNSSNEIKKAFLMGFNDGDGLKKGYKSTSEFKNFKTKSRILAMGLCYLIKNSTGQRVTLNFEDRNSGYFSINLNSVGRGTREGQHLKKPHDMIKKIRKVQYDSFVYDLETEDHVFHGGVGGNLFHNTGPRRGEVFATSNFAKQIAEIEKGIKEPVIFVGNLNASRDFTDVRDVVKAYTIAVEKCDYGEAYNICSGRGWKISDMLQLLLSMSKKKIEIRQDPARMRPSDVEILLGDYSKFHKKTGWVPQIPFEQTMKDLLDYWRNLA